MIQPSMARKYARALVEVGGSKGTLENVIAQVRAVADLAAQDVALADFLSSRSYPDSAKRELIDTLLDRLYPEGIDPITRNFFAALALHRRLSDYLDIVRVLEEAVDDAEGVVKAQLVTATPLDAGQQASVEKALRAATGKKVRLEVGVDADLLAGAVTRIGSTIYDGSVRTQLRKVKARIAAGEA